MPAKSMDWDEPGVDEREESTTSSAKPRPTPPEMQTDRQ